MYPVSPVMQIFRFILQHPFVTEFTERQVRIQIKDQIDRMKRKKIADEYEYSGSDEEGGSLDPPTVKKHGDGEMQTNFQFVVVTFVFYQTVSGQELQCPLLG